MVSPAKTPPRITSKAAVVKYSHNDGSSAGFGSESAGTKTSRATSETGIAFATGNEAAMAMSMKSRNQDRSEDFCCPPSVEAVGVEAAMHQAMVIQWWIDKLLID
jgi:hypothetical protein